jgi:hypothetical protein
LGISEGRTVGDLGKDFGLECTEIFVMIFGVVMHFEGGLQIKIRHDISVNQNEVVTNFNSLSNRANGIAETLGVFESDMLNVKVGLLANLVGVLDSVNLLF